MKTTIKFLITILMILLLSACGSETESDTTENTATTTQNAETNQNTENSASVDEPAEPVEISYSSFTHDQYDLYVEYPDTWTVEEDESGTITLSIESNNDNSGGIMIMGHESEGFGAISPEGIAEMLQAVSTDFRDTNIGSQVVEPVAPLAINGLTSARTTIEVPGESMGFEGTDKVVFDLYLIANGDMILNLFAFLPDTQQAEWGEAMHRVVNSLANENLRNLSQAGIPLSEDLIFDSAETYPTGGDLTETTLFVDDLLFTPSIYLDQDWVDQYGQPAELAIAENFTIYQFLFRDRGGAYETTTIRDDVVDFYLNELPQAGWQIVNITAAEASSSEATIRDYFSGKESLILFQNIENPSQMLFVDANKEHYSINRRDGLNDAFWMVLYDNPNVGSLLPTILPTSTNTPELTSTPSPSLIQEWEIKTGHIKALGAAKDGTLYGMMWDENNNFSHIVISSQGEVQSIYTMFLPK